jgi:RNA polymerase-binding transcription factor DksA
MAERSIAGRVRRAVADAAAATKLVGTGGTPPDAPEGAEPAPPETAAPRSGRRSGSARVQPEPAPRPKRATTTATTRAPSADAAAEPVEAAQATPEPATAARESTASESTASEPAASKATGTTTPPEAPAPDLPREPASPRRPPAKRAQPARAKAAGAKASPAKPDKGPAAAPTAAEPPGGDGPAAPAPPARTLVVQRHEEPWSAEEIEEVRRELQGDLDRLRAEVAEAEAGIADLLLDPSGVGGEDQADAGSKTFEREHEMALAASHRELLAQTERALLRLDEGTLGVCESCGNPIGKARVQAFPRATLCLTCKQREERR